MCTLGVLGGLDDVPFVPAGGAVLKHLQHGGHAVGVARQLDDFLQNQKFIYTSDFKACLSSAFLQSVNLPLAFGNAS